MSCFSSCFGNSSNHNERNFNSQIRKIKVHNFDQVDHTITENFKMSPKMVKRLGNINVCNMYLHDTNKIFLTILILNDMSRNDKMQFFREIDLRLLLILFVKIYNI